jgi:hypothetical protein
LVKPQTPPPVESRDELSLGDKLEMLELEVRMLAKLISALTGREFKFMRPVSPNALQRGGPHNGQAQKGNAEPGYGYGVILEQRTSYAETESMNFSAQAIITTQEGEELAVSIDLGMSRQFYDENELSIRAGDALKDPIVVNFDAPAVALTGKTFAFDLDNDGTTSQLAQLGVGSGYLAYDRNGNGAIDNGSELFGPSTGNGFMELADHDSDENGWLDENDPIFEGLRIWAPDENGAMNLFGLVDKSVGAVYVNALKTPFAIKDAANNLQGAVRATSFFVGDEGAGSVQQIDLKV